MSFTEFYFILGFYEGGKVNPNPLTWLDRLLVGLLGGLAYYHDNTAMKQTSSLTL